MVFQEYQDPKVGKYLKYGYWYAAHREQLYRIFVSMLLAVVALVWFNLVYRTYVYTQERSAHQAVLWGITRSLVDSDALRQARAPEPPRIKDIAVMSGGAANTADFAVFIKNSNADWYMELAYSFVWPGGSTVIEEAFLLPGEERPLAVRGATVNALPTAAEVRLSVSAWQRIRNTDERAAIAETLGAITVAPGRASASGDTTMVSYSVQNGSRYDIIAPQFVVVLSRLGEPVAIGQNSIAVLKSGSEELFEYRWLENYGAGLSTAVYPVVNLLDPSVRALPEGNPASL